MTSLSPPVIELPFIDFSQGDLKPGTSSWLASSKQVISALEEYACGCFIAKYDKLSLLHDALFSAFKEIFDLPLETKRNFFYDIPFFGYVESHPVFRPLYESFGIHEAITLEGAQIFIKSMWPDGNDLLCKTILAYTGAAAELEEMVMRMVFEGYGVGKSFESYKESTSYQFRMMKYRVPMKDEVKVGCNTHKDMDFLSLLDQNQVNGLEMKTKDGQWHSIDVKPSTFAIMSGEPLMAWSNGRIHAVEHRVTMKGDRDRYSVGLFSYSKQGMVEVPKELVDHEHPLQFKPFNHYDMMHHFSKVIYAGEDTSIRAYCGV